MSGEKPSEKLLPDLSAANSEQRLAVSPVRTWIACAAALVLPGSGHLILGRWVRGIVIAFGIALMFSSGFLMQGHLFKPERGEWISWLFSFANMGIGLLYFILLAADIGFQLAPNQAAAPTFEYGNTFLLVAGLLNMLAVMDTYDIAVGRKT